MGRRARTLLDITCAVAALAAAGCGIWHPREAEPTPDSAAPDAARLDAAPPDAGSARAHPCDFPNAETQPYGDHECVMGACAPGWSDANHRSDDGCETPCNGRQEREEGRCNNGIDDDCDGYTDGDDRECDPNAVEGAEHLYPDCVGDHCDLTDTHPDHCGELHHPCPRHVRADAVCIKGHCQLACLPVVSPDGVVEARVDRWPGNGCEELCQQSGEPDDDCDHVDDDCDGRYDEHFVGVPCPEAGDVERHRTCRDGHQSCRPTAELCVQDGSDGRRVGCGVGACAVEARCDGGRLVGCTPGDPIGPDDTCDGVDDDCDGITDEGADICEVPGSLCHHRCGLDAGRAVCKTTRRDPIPGDGVDDDCDGDVDEELVEPAVPCAPVAGVDHRGDPCDPGADCSCDEVDDDCDGQLNEDFAPTDHCDPWRQCDIIDGVRQVVRGDVPDEREICNGIDDDCNGRIDDLAPRPCDDDTLGVCRLQAHCVGGLWSCEVPPGPVVPPNIDPTCDGIDEDCDGRLDEGFPPPPGVDRPSCGRGLCARAPQCCSQGTCEVGGFEPGEVRPGHPFAGCDAPRAVQIEPAADGWRVTPQEADPVIHVLGADAAHRVDGRVLDLPDPIGGLADPLAADAGDDACEPERDPDDQPPMGGDIDCDGVDGTLAAAVFVSSAGVPAGALSAGTLAEAIATASAAGRPHIYLAEGATPSGAAPVDGAALCLPAGLSIFGGFDPSDWSQRIGRSTVDLSAGGVATTATGLRVGGCDARAGVQPAAGRVWLDGLDLTVGVREVGATPPDIRGVEVTGGVGVRLRGVVVRVGAATSVGPSEQVGSAYGVVSHGARIELEDTRLEVGSGGPGITGAPPADGDRGRRGGAGDGGAAAVDGAACPAHAAGGGGADPICDGAAAGSGGVGSAVGGAGTPADHSRDCGAPGAVGEGLDGDDGCAGRDGLDARPPAAAVRCFEGRRYRPLRADDGEPGHAGQGGDGGDGAGGRRGPGRQCHSAGGGGGGGGAGGCGGRGGAGGLGGGGSFGVVAPGCVGCRFIRSTVVLGGGGRGGLGAVGQPGGPGGAGGEGGRAIGSGNAGGDGGDGGDGGRGGRGADAPDGPQICALIDGADVPCLLCELTPGRDGLSSISEDPAAWPCELDR